MFRRDPLRFAGVPASFGGGSVLFDSMSTRKGRSMFYARDAKASCDLVIWTQSFLALAARE
jgi:hypothetical protein